MDGLHHFLHGAFAAHAFAVDAQYVGVRKALLEEFFRPLGAGTQWAQILALAFGAVAIERALTVAVMAMQVRRRLVHGHACIAAAAFGNPAAVVAHQGRGKAAAVDEYQNLIAALEVFADQLGQRAGQAAFQWPAANIQALKRRCLGVAGADGQAQVPVAALLHVVQTLE